MSLVDQKIALKILTENEIPSMLNLAEIHSVCRSYITLRNELDLLRDQLTIARHDMERAGTTLKELADAFQK